MTTEAISVTDSTGTQVIELGAGSPRWAADIGFVPTGTIAATTVQAAIVEAAGEDVAHTTDTDAHAGNLRGAYYFYHPSNVGTIAVPVTGDVRFVIAATGLAIAVQVRSAVAAWTDVFKSTSAGVLTATGNIIAKSGDAADQVTIGDVGPGGEPGILMANGALLYGGGGAALRAAGFLFAASHIRANADGAAETWIGNVGPASQSGIKFGSAGDVNLYRDALNVLKTDDQLVALEGVTGKYVTGAGRVNGSDDDFLVTPANGTTYTVRNSTTGLVYLTTRANGTWFAVQVT